MYTLPYVDSERQIYVRQVIGEPAVATLAQRASRHHAIAFAPTSLARQLWDDERLLDTKSHIGEYGLCLMSSKKPFSWIAHEF